MLISIAIHNMLDIYAEFPVFFQQYFSNMMVYLI